MGCTQLPPLLKQHAFTHDDGTVTCLELEPLPASTCTVTFFDYPVPNTCWCTGLCLLTGPAFASGVQTPKHDPGLPGLEMGGEIMPGLIWQSCNVLLGALFTALGGRPGSGGRRPLLGLPKAGGVGDPS